MTILSNNKKQGTQQSLSNTPNTIDANDAVPQNLVIANSSPILTDIESLNSKTSDETVPIIAEPEGKTTAENTTNADETKTVNIQINDIQNVSGIFSLIVLIASVLSHIFKSIPFHEPI